MSPDVPPKDASKEVPPLPLSGAWFGAPGDDGLSSVGTASETEMSLEQEVLLEPTHMQALEEDIARQMTAARDFTSLLAAEIVDSAVASLHAAARLGPHRVAALLTWDCTPAVEPVLTETHE